MSTSATYGEASASPLGPYNPRIWVCFFMAALSVFLSVLCFVYCSLYFGGISVFFGSAFPVHYISLNIPFYFFRLSFRFSGFCYHLRKPFAIILFSLDFMQPSIRQSIGPRLKLTYCCFHS